MSEQDCKKLRIIAGINIVWPLAAAACATASAYMHPFKFIYGSEEDESETHRYWSPVVFAWIGFGYVYF